MPAMTTTLNTGKSKNVIIPLNCSISLVSLFMVPFYFQQSLSSHSQFQAFWSWSRQSLPKLSLLTPVKVSFSSLCQPSKVSSLLFLFSILDS